MDRVKKYNRTSIEFNMLLINCRASLIDRNVVNSEIGYHKREIISYLRVKSHT